MQGDCRRDPAGRECHVMSRAEWIRESGSRTGKNCNMTVPMDVPAALDVSCREPGATRRGLAACMDVGRRLKEQKGFPTAGASGNGIPGIQEDMLPGCLPWCQPGKRRQGEGT